MTEPTDNKTFVYNDCEVKKTGRTASRKVGASNAVMVEVTPNNPDDGTWKKWVAELALFVIND